VDDEFLERIFQRCHGQPWEIARTKRCVIRELSLEDLPALEKLYQKEGVTWRLDADGERIPGFIEPLFAKEKEKKYQQAYITNMYGYYGYGMWLVFDKASGELIGRAGLEHREFPDAVELELGYLIDPDRQGQGLATEVCQAILAFAREELDFPRVNALTDQKNVASVALLQKLGFYYLEDTDVSGSRTQRYIYEFS
jgi:RimJ/RimL family protein N-acetyltransferase